MPQVGRDGAEHLLLLLRQHEVVPGEAGLQPRGEVAEPARGGPPRAVVEVVRRRRLVAARRGRDAGDLGGLGDLPQREAELRRRVARVLGARERRPGVAPLGEGRHRRVERERDGVAERGGGPGCAGDQQHALGRARAGRGRAGPLDGSSRSRPSKTPAASARAAARRGVARRRRGVERVVHRRSSRGCPAPRRAARARRARTSTGCGSARRAGRAGRRRSRARPGSYAGGATTRRRPSPSRCASISPASRNAASRSATFAPRSASGVGPLPWSSSRSAPSRRSGASRLEAREHVGRGDALAGEQAADEPRARAACA